MSRVRRRLAAFLILCLACIDVIAQTPIRRLTTIDAIRQFPGYYHLSSVLLRGELVESGGRIVLRADDRELRVVLKDVSARSGLLEVRGQVIDVGRLEPTDSRTAALVGNRENVPWPAPGEEMLLNVSAAAEAQTSVTPSIRALALEPWKFEGQTVTVVGAFRGRNLFGDVADAPGTSRYDFVLRGAEGAVWVTGLRPRGRGFELDVERRMDTGRWLQVTGTVARARGLVSIQATQLAEAKEPEAPPSASEALEPSAPPEPLQVVFSSPTEGEVDVATTTSTVRVQFSRGLRQPTLQGRVRATYLGTAPGSEPLPVTLSYDAASRSIQIRFAQPLERFRTVRVELLDGIQAFDGGPLAPWTLTFSVGAT